MNQPVSTPAEPTDRSAPAAKPEGEVPAASPPAPRASTTAAPTGASGGWFGTTMLVVALLALLLSGMLWQRLDRIQQELAKRSASVAEESEQSLEAAHEAKALVQELQARLTLAEVKLSEVSLQRTQLEELMLSVSRSRDDTLVLDIESGVRLAMQQAELTGSAQPLVSALQAAMRRIEKAAQPRLNPVQRAMARDLEKIKASSLADLPMLAARLDELARSVDGWVLANEVGRVRTGGGQKAAAPAKTGAAAAEAPSSAPMPAQPVPSEPPMADAAAAIGTPTGGWRWPDWSAGWARLVTPVWEATRDLVRVSRIDEPDAALLTPQQAVFLKENLKLRLLNIRLSLLSRQITAARADMQFVKGALNKYFDAHHPLNRQVLTTLEEALQASRSLELPRPDDTLAALATAAGGR